MGTAFSDIQSFPAVRGLLGLVGCLGSACATYGYGFGTLLQQQPDLTFAERQGFVEAFTSQSSNFGSGQAGNLAATYKLRKPNDPDGPGVGIDPPPLKANWLVRASPASVPEPNMLPLLGSGLIGLLGYGWRRRKRVA